MALVAALPVLVMSLALQRQFIRSIASAGVKG
jgi:ABC-type glycerol-3-phosphate transport system permease component